MEKVHRPRMAVERFAAVETNVRSNTGYKGENGVNRFDILDVQRQIRFMNKVVIAVCLVGPSVGGTACTWCVT